MGALKIAFDAPDNSSPARPSKGRPIDLVHLATQTMGDKTLELDVLQMFARQARMLMKDLSGDDLALRQPAAHRLKGAALAVGAFNVAAVAGGVEDKPDDAEALSALSAAMLETELFILKLCR